MNPKMIQPIVRLALKEDMGKGDITTQLLIDPLRRAQARIFIKENATICGITFMRAVFKQLDPHCRFTAHRKDGADVRAGTTVAHISGKARALLTGERVALNFLGHLSGIATQTQHFVNKAGKNVDILETRKTIPGLRYAQKYAVRCGGGVNHRVDLHAYLMIKDNHRQVCSTHMSLTDMITIARRKTRKKIVMEVDTWREFKEVLPAKPDIILLDNMRPAQLKKAVQARNQQKGRKVLLESSGGVTLKNVAAMARAGVDRISIGALTHSPTSIDVSMEFFS